MYNFKKALLEVVIVKNLHPRYMCFPSVVEVGKETRVIIKPRDISRYFKSDKEYELRIIGFSDDMPSYLTPNIPNCDFEISGGCLIFNHTFESEQEYSIRFCEKGTRETRISLYAVESDLYSLRALKGDFHSHSYYSDGADGLAMTPADYREEGFDFFALTDHNRMYTSKMAAKLYENVPIALNIINGEEVHTPGSMLHIVHIGGSYSVCEKYILNNDSYECEVEEIEKTLTHVPEQYRKRTAMAHWACNEIHKAGGIAIFAHPLWRPNIDNISKEFRDILFNEKIFDAFEVLGATGQKNSNIQLALWQEQLLKGNNIPVVSSSDSHNHNFYSTDFARRFTIVFAKSNTTEDILDAVRSGKCVAAEIPMGDDNEIRFYCKNVRLVNFAHFLYEYYFSETQRLCVGEGILMRRYAEGEDVKKALAELLPTTDNFYKEFFGKKPALTMPEERLEFLNECLHLQKTVGPDTCGSNLKVYGTNIKRE